MIGLKRKRFLFLFDYFSERERKKDIYSTVPVPPILARETDHQLLESYRGQRYRAYGTYTFCKCK